MDVIGTIEVQDEPVAVGAMKVMYDGSFEDANSDVQEESLLKVYVNDILTMQIGCSANHLVELVTGRLFTEGLIRTPDEIDALSICEFSMDAHLYLKDREADLTKTEVSTVPTCCTNNKLLNNYFGTGEPLRPVPQVRWDPVHIFDASHEFRRDNTAHAVTRGSHSAYLFRNGELLCLREDIGRHNAFDKAIGWALIEGVDLSQCMLYTSGRVPTDMLTKAIRAGLPVLVTKSVPTDKAVEMAREFKITLVCSACPKSFEIMNGAELMLPLDLERMKRPPRD